MDVIRQRGNPTASVDLHEIGGRPASGQRAGDTYSWTADNENAHQAPSYGIICLIVNFLQFDSLAIYFSAFIAIWVFTFRCEFWPQSVRFVSEWVGGEDPPHPAQPLHPFHSVCIVALALNFLIPSARLQPSAALQALQLRPHLTRLCSSFNPFRRPRISESAALGVPAAFSCARHRQGTQGANHAAGFATAQRG